MPETELLIKKTEALPPALFEEAVHYIDYLSQKAQSTYFTEKLAEAESKADKPNAVWLNEDEFWGEDGYIHSPFFTVCKSIYDPLTDTPASHGGTEKENSVLPSP